MGDIFSKASSVVCWLGSGTKNSAYGMQRLRWPLRKKDSQSKTRLSRCLDDVLSRPYWNRIWVVQEIAKARSLELWCDQDRLTWSELLQNTFYHDHMLDLASQLRRVRDLDIFREREWSGMQVALWEAMMITIGKDASDERDRVYALLPLIYDGADVVRIPDYVKLADEILQRDDAQVVPTPNYAQDVMEVFKAVSRDMIVTQGQTALILLAGLRNNPPCSPSWIPLWFSEDAQLPPWIVDCVNKHETQFEPKTHAEDGRLSVPGFMLETIAKAEVDPADLSNSANTKPKIKSTSETVGVICEISSFLVSCNDSQDVPSRTVEVTRAHALVALWLSAREVLPPQLPLLRRWYDEHRHWPFQSRSIVEWVEGHNRLSRQASWYSSTESIDVLKPLEISLRLMEQHNMRMVLTDRTGFRGSLRMAHKASTKGDLIYRLENCALPVVLRPDLDGTFTVVGEALGRRDGKNNNWQAHIGWIESGFKHWRTITIV